MCRTVVSAVAVLAVQLLLAVGNASGDEDPLVALGRGYFLSYCASCHGADARGDGPVAPALATKPTDLTRLSARGDGALSDEEIAAYIAGERVLAAHGSREMPVWGKQFVEKGGEGETGRLIARGQLHVLITYLRAIQQPDPD